MSLWFRERKKGGMLGKKKSSDGHYYSYILTQDTWGEKKTETHENMRKGEWEG